MKADELRKKYLEFFESKKHAIIGSASLIPENDPTVLFTTAGMHPLVPFLMGQNHPLGKRLADCQKCLRTDDIDEVGDSFHLTFFEMLGNWSLGDYFKKEAIEWSFEFLIKWLKIPIEKISVSVFAGDADAPRDEFSAKVWSSLGIPKERIFYFLKNSIVSFKGLGSSRIFGNAHFFNRSLRNSFFVLLKTAFRRVLMKVFMIQDVPCYFFGIKIRCNNA